MKNNKKVNGWYNQALGLNEQLYALMGEIFKDNDLVSYTVEVSRWDDRIGLRVFALISNGKASDELRELVGVYSEMIDFAEYTKQEEIDGFVNKVAGGIKTFARCAGIVLDIINKKQ